MCCVMPPASPAATFVRADVVEQRGLAVVDVAHDGDHGRTRLFVLGHVLALQVFFDLVALEHLGDVAHLLDHQRRGVAIDGLVDGGHDAHVHHGLDDFGGLDGHLLRDFLRRDGLADGHFALDRRGGHFEGVLRLDTAHRTGGAFLDAPSSSCSARSRRRRRAVPGGRNGSRPWRDPALRPAPSRGLWRSGRTGLHMRGRGLGGGAALRILLLPGLRFFLRLARLLRPGACAWLRLRCGGDSPPPCARFRGARLPGARARH